MRFIQTEYRSSYYELAKQLRHAVLRVPLGLALSEEDISDDANRMHFVAVDGEILVGTVSMKPISREVVKLRQMAIATNHQGQGIGQQLVEFAEEMMREFDYASVETHARIAAQKFYERLGYAPEGEMFMETGVPHILMKKIL